MKKRMLKLFTLGAVITSIGATTFGAEGKFFYNGESILKDSKTIVEDGTTYLPLRDLAKALGIDVVFENGNVYLVEQNQAVSKISLNNIVGENNVVGDMSLGQYDVIGDMSLEVGEDNMVAEIPQIQYNTIVDIAKKDDKTVSITISNSSSDSTNPMSHTIIHVTEDTTYRHEINKMAYTLDSLQVGDIVTVYTGPVTTLSLPPQTTAVEIVVHDAMPENLPVIPELALPVADLEMTDEPIVAEIFYVDDVEENNVTTLESHELVGDVATLESNELVENVATLENVYILQINEIENGVQITVGNPEAPEDIMQQTIINVQNETAVKHHMNRRMYRVSDLTVGQTITVNHLPIMTMSIPAQITASNIVIINDAIVAE